MRWLATALLCWPMLAQALYPCVPKEIGGSGTYYRLTDVPNAYALQWVCVDAAGKPGIYGPVWRKNFAPSVVCAASLPSMTLAGLPDPVAAINTAAAACKTMTPDATGGYADPDVDLALRTGVAAIRAAWAADHPASGPIYRSTGTGRIYLYKSATQLGADTGRKAAVNTLCDCTLAQTAVGTSLYCALSGGPSTEVTYCTKR